MHRYALISSSFVARPLVVLLLAVMCWMALPATGGAAAQTAPGTSGQVLVRVDPSARGDLPGRASGVAGWRVVSPRGTETPEEALRRARRHRDVIDAHLESLYHLQGTLGLTDPDDPLWSWQWNLATVGVSAAWAASTGSGVDVAIVDSGITGGEDLQCRPLAGEYDAINQVSGPGVAQDAIGHGTHVAGTVAQCTNNGKGVAGVAPGARLMAVKAIDDDGSATESAVARGIAWAADHGAEVINLSLGHACTKPWPDCSGSMLNEAIEHAVAQGVVLVAAAGNQGNDHLAHPANHPDVMAVTATTSGRRIADYSNRGPGVSVAAPGGDHSDRDGDGHDDGILQGMEDAKYGFRIGTSLAAPHVSGIAALLLGADASLSPAKVHDLIELSARDLGALGYDETYGHGEVRADAALTLLLGALDGATSTASTGFEDVAAGSTFEDDILWLASEGFTKGCNPPDNTRFCPDRSVTRAQMAAFLVRALGLTDTSIGGNFSDVPADHTFTTDINKLATAGITKGCNPPHNTRFCPDQPVSRAQMAAFLSRAFGLPSASVRFIDVAAGSTFAEDISRLAGSGITRGCNPPDNDRFCPDRDVTRAQMAAFLHRAIG